MNLHVWLRELKVWGLRFRAEGVFGLLFYGSASRAKILEKIPETRALNANGFKLVLHLPNSVYKGGQEPLHLKV